MKQVLTNHDLRILVDELQYLVGARLNQVYDINSHTICLKLDFKIGEEKFKKYLILDSGNKIYTIDQFNSIRTTPTSFSSKLRKHLNNKRISSIYRLRGDRVVVINFGIDEYLYSIYIELYASGNILLIDKDKTILNLLHVFVYDENTKVKVKQTYPVESATQDVNNLVLNPIEVFNWFHENKPVKKIKLKMFFNKSPLSSYGPIIIDHTATLMGFNINQKIDSEFINNLDFLEIKELCENIKEEFFKPVEKKGFIIIEDDESYSSVIPVNYEHFKNKPKLVFNSFEEACAKYFTELDKNKFNSNCQKEIENTKIHDKIIDQDKRRIKNISDQINNLEDKGQQYYDISSIVEDNIHTLDCLIKDVNKLIQNKQIDLIQDLIKRKYHNIEFIDINFKDKLFTIVLNDNKISLDYSINIYKNLTSKYYTGKTFKKKADRAKEAKNKIEQELDNINKKKEKIKQELIEIPGKNKDLWFEKFNWFISSDNYLVVSGKTADQNEEIVKKYLDKFDIYVHSNMAGSGSCVIKNPDNKTIPLSTIEQAGHYVVCKTKAWIDGVVDKAWWVNPNQVSKTTESGEFVGKGSFIIRGKKNYIHECSLELGMGIMFKLKDKVGLCYEANETVEFAVPMCGPFKSFKNAKFKVKLRPGTMKITKVLKEMISRFNKEANIYEKSAIKKIHTDEFHRVRVNKVKLC